jgi:hypothetical protein
LSLQAISIKKYKIWFQNGLASQEFSLGVTLENMTRKGGKDSSGGSGIKGNAPLSEDSFIRLGAEDQRMLQL